ncbi:hypothetical protein M514_00143 [Trichuris suis]|uniref:Uncharacterized protein n=1 Tax=Trichuris suis TaxID=68888 RepID=A0A085NU65_9BILA|nr:hypothetical protein M513_00143 [Trichuris suis]KFD73011.1 hypothetical protein M514_00143 [Trichuris suis]
MLNESNMNMFLLQEFLSAALGSLIMRFVYYNVSQEQGNATRGALERKGANEGVGKPGRH